jgi:hypothetical protein
MRTTGGHGATRRATKRRGQTFASTLRPTGPWVERLQPAERHDRYDPFMSPKRSRVRRVLVGIALIGTGLVLTTHAVGAVVPGPPECARRVVADDAERLGLVETGFNVLSADGNHALVELAEGTGPNRFIDHLNVATGTRTRIPAENGLLIDITPDGRYALYLEAALSQTRRLMRIDTTTMTMSPIVTTGFFVKPQLDGGAVRYGLISDDGSKVATQGASTSGGFDDEVYIVTVATGAAQRITSGAPGQFDASFLTAMSGDANIVVTTTVSQTLRRVWNRSAGTYVTVPEDPLDFNIRDADVMSRDGRYLFMANGKTFDRISQTLTQVVTAPRYFRGASKSGRFLYAFNNSLLELHDRTTGAWSTIGSPTGQRPFLTSIADDGQTTLVVAAETGAQSPSTFVSRADLPMLRLEYQIAVPIGGTRSIATDGFLPAGTTGTLVPGTSLAFTQRGARTILTISADDTVAETPRPIGATVTLPNGCHLQILAGTFMIRDFKLDARHGVGHAGQAGRVGYGFDPVYGFAATALTIDGLPTGPLLPDDDNNAYTIEAPVTVPANTPAGSYDVTVETSDPDDFFVFPNSFAVRSYAGELHAVAPARIVDTRNGTGGRTGPIVAGNEATFTVSGVGGVPASGVDAVVMNVTVVDPSEASYLTIWPAGFTRPTASNLNFSRGQTIPNLVTTKVSTSGGVSVFVNDGLTALIFDVVGWYSTAAPAVSTGGGAFVPLDPTRVIDTRSGAGIPIGRAGTLKRQIAPAGSSIAAVVLNVTVTGPTSGGYLSVVPSGATPSTSSLNFVANQTVANLVIVPLGRDGSIDFYNAEGTVHVLADIFGFFDNGSAPISDGQLEAVSPVRVFDSRGGIGIAAGLRPAGDIATLDLSSRLPADASAVVVNVTVTSPTGDGYVSVWPADGGTPDTSNLNYVAGLTAPNLVIVPVSADGSIKLATAQSSAHLIVDLLGWFTSR